MSASDAAAADATTGSAAASFEAAYYLQNPKPAYPAMARRMGEHGKVLLRVTVTAEGSAAEVSVETTSGSS